MPPFVKTADDDARDFVRDVMRVAFQVMRDMKIPPGVAIQGGTRAIVELIIAGELASPENQWRARWERELPDVFASAIRDLFPDIQGTV